MLRQFMESLQGYQFFGILSTIIFFLYFSWMIVYALRIPRKDIAAFSQIPLEDTSEFQQLETEKNQ
jgi:hypothetical protein